MPGMKAETMYGSTAEVPRKSATAQRDPVRTPAPEFRPGKPTEEFLGRVTNRITLGGALFLGTIAVLPYIVSAFIPGTQ